MENEEQKTEEKTVKTKEERKDFLSEARELAETNKKAVEEMRELVKRNEEIAAKNLLGGKSEVSPEPEKKEETPADYAKKVMSGEV